MLSRGRVVERDADGLPRRAVGTLTDLTDRREAERLRVERDRAEAASRAKSEFLSRMSHELRTPLNAVLGFAQVLASRIGQASPDEQRRQVHQIETAGWHLLQLIDDVLDMARLQQDQLDLGLEPVSLPAAASAALHALAPLAREHGVQLTLGSVPERATVRADARHLHQVLSNLVSNAVKYNRVGGHVRVSVAATASGWALAVSDTGPGIPAAQVPHLFEPFNRLGRANGGGVGLGLALARTLVERMGGSLTVDSAYGAGSTFTVTLPGA